MLAADAAADRDSPALARSVRDGYAVRAIDLPGQLEIIGEVRAGERFAGELAAGQAVEIMTGAPIPSGADAVVMIEHTRREGRRVVIHGAAEAGQFINPRGCEAAGPRGAPARRQAPGLHRYRPAGGHRAGAGQGLPAAGGGDRGHRRRNRRGSRNSRGISNSQFQRLVAGGTGGARRRHARGAPGGARYRGAYAGDDRARSPWRTCCCSPAGCRRASTT